MTHTPENFAFPVSYNPDLAADLHSSDHRAELTLGWSYAGKWAGTYITPLTLFKRYVNSDLGRHQSAQTSRYPNFHRDLHDDLIPPHLETDSQKEAFRRSFLDGLLPIRNPSLLHRRHSQAFDFEPTGHMARAAIAFNTAVFESPVADLDINPFWLQTGRYKELVHDTGENTAEAIRLRHGQVVGDISMQVGKTDEERTLESAIQEGILDDLYHDTLPLPMREAIVTLSAHDTESLPADGRLVHDIAEVSHQDNSILTAFFAYKAAVRTLRRGTDTENIYLAGNYMALVDQANRKVPPKYSESLAHSPKLRLTLGAHVRDKLIRLENTTHHLDDYPKLLSWRMSEPVVSHYGEYVPKAA